MNVLYIAYSCSPSHGSEDKIGWQIPWESSRWNQVYVITKEEQRPFVEAYLKEHPRQHLHFFYVDIPSVYKKIYKGCFYSGRLNIWHRRALPVAEKICREYGISVIHQITPVEFRAIGNYGSIPGVRFVCGPVGGGEFVPEGLRHYGKGNSHLELIRRTANAWSKVQLRKKKILSRCDCILFANAETKNDLCPDGEDAGYSVMPEIGIAVPEEINPSHETTSGEKPCRFLVAGRLVYRKGHAFLLDALEELPEDLAYECRIVGSGPEADRLRRRCNDNQKLSEHVVFRGNVSFAQMQEEYGDADVLIMPSLRETTGTVVLEAMSQGLPVITINRFGAKNILTEETGWLYDGSSRESFVAALRQAFMDCISRPEEISRRGAKARLRAKDFAWEKKMAYYQSLYEAVCGSPKE